MNRLTQSNKRIEFILRHRKAGCPLHKLRLAKLTPTEREEYLRQSQRLRANKSIQLHPERKRLANLRSYTKHRRERLAQQAINRRRRRQCPIYRAKENRLQRARYWEMKEASV